jgi:hypothetical protein
MARLSTTVASDKTKAAVTPEMDGDKTTEKDQADRGKQEQSAADKALAEENSKLQADMKELKVCVFGG